MASEGSFNTSAYNNRHLTFSWWVNSQDIGNNKTNIGWKLVGAGSKTGYYKAGNFKVVINGSTVYSSSDRIELYQGTQVASGSLDIYHESDGNKSFSASAEAGIYYVAVNCSGSGSWSLPSIPRQANLTAAPDFNDEANPTITYSNPAGNSASSLQACISLTGANADVGYRDISKTGTSYTFNLTTEERNVLRNACTTSNSRKVTFFVRTVIGGNTFYSTIERTLTIVNATPVFSSSNLSYKDNNSTTTAVTGNNQHLVQNLSKLLVTISAAGGQKGASITKYDATINGVTKTITSSGNIDYGVINSGTNLTLTVKVTDSRGNTNTATKTVTFLAWTLPTALISLKRKNNYENETYLKVDGAYSSVNSKNSLTIQYQYKKTTESSYSSLATLSDNVQITMTKDKESAWDFKIVLTDKFGTTTYNAVLPKGRFIFFVDTKKLSVGINCFPAYSESLEINGERIQNPNLNVSPYMMEQRWMKLCNIKFPSHVQGEFAYFKIFIGDGNNGNDTQNAYIELIMQLGWTGSVSGRFGCNAILHPIKTSFTTSNTKIKVLSNSNVDYDIWFTASSYYCRPNYYANTSKRATVTPKWETTTTEPTGTECNLAYTSV